MKTHQRLYRMTTYAAYGAAWTLASLALVAGLVSYGHLPASMMAHWNAVGEPDGYVSRPFGVLLLPFIIVFVATIALMIPRIDPLRENIEAFRPSYNVFVFLVTAVLAIVQLCIIAVNLGVALSMGVIVMPAIGVLFFAIGIFLPDTKRNYFIGIRTPWTIASDVVWQRTHILGGRIFKVLGVAAILSLLAPTYAIYIFLVPLLVAVIGLVLYSYAVYREIGA